MPTMQPPSTGNAATFRFWTPAPGTTIPVGADRRALELPHLALPVHREALAGGDPAPDAIGQGLYDYLRQFPDCPRGTAYAELLREAFPHFLADLGAQLAMLDHKDVDPPYVRRKINGLKVLALLAPDNAALQQQIGLAWLQLALTFTEMGASRNHLQGALRHLGRAESLAPEDPAILTSLGQVDYLLGDVPSALRRWRRALDHLEESGPRSALAERVAQIEARGLPDHPLVEEFETVGEALALCGEDDFAGACSRLDRLAERGLLPEELPSAEFFYLLGYCRERTGDAAGAFEAYDRSLLLEAGYPPAAEGRERILASGAGSPPEPYRP